MFRQIPENTNVNEKDYRLDNMNISYAEEVCLNRCLGKIVNVRDVVMHKMKDSIEMPPLLFN